MKNIKIILKNDMEFILSATSYDIDCDYFYFYDKQNNLISSINKEFVSKIYAWWFIFYEENNQRLAKKETLNMFEEGNVLCQKL